MIWVHLLAALVLALVLAGWALLGRWFTRRNPAAPSSEARLGSCAGCAGACATYVAGSDGAARAGGSCVRRDPSVRRGATLGVVAVFGVVALALGIGLWRAPAAGAGEDAATVTTSFDPRDGAGFVQRRRRIMSTWIELTVRERDADRAAAEVFGTFAEVDRRMSEWRESSPLSAVNRAAGRAAVVVPADLRAVIRRGLAVGRATDGAFDITWAALWGLWRFKGANLRPPAAAAIVRRRALVDYRGITVDDAAGTVRLARPGMKIGLGGIAKGYAIELAVGRLRARGVRDFLLSAGGQIWAAGSRGARPWRVGIRAPRGGRGDYFATLTLRDRSVSTSGDYERFFVHEGRRYHHILDPRTGRPARGLRSATVVSADAVLADALSTALMVMGRDRGLALVRAQSGIEAVVVDGVGRVTATPGLELDPAR